MPAVCCCRTTGCAGCTKNSHPSTAPSMQPDRTSWRRVEYRIDAVRGALPVLAGVAAGRVRRSRPTPTVPITAAAFPMPICWNLTLRCTGATDTFSDLPFPVSWQDTVTGVRPRRCPDRPEPRVCGKEHRPPRRTAGPVGGARRCPHRHLHLLTSVQPAATAWRRTRFLGATAVLVLLGAVACGPAASGPTSAPDNGLPLGAGQRFAADGSDHRRGPATPPGWTSPALIPPRTGCPSSTWAPARSSRSTPPPTRSCGSSTRSPACTVC